MLQTALTRKEGASKYVEFATITDNSVRRTQVEYKHGLIFMRAKKRMYALN